MADSLAVSTRVACQMLANSGVPISAIEGAMAQLRPVSSADGLYWDARAVSRLAKRFTARKAA